MAAKTYAQQAKTIMNKYKLRLGDKFDKGDPLALAAMNAELAELQNKQEESRQVEAETQQVEQQEAIQQFANGGKLTKKQQGTLSDILSTLPQGAVQREGVFQNPTGDTLYSNVGRQGDPNFIPEPLSAFRNPQGFSNATNVPQSLGQVSQEP